MSNFKVGDRVRRKPEYQNAFAWTFVSENSRNEPFSVIGVIQRNPADKPLIKLVIPGFISFLGGGLSSWDEDYFELVEVKELTSLEEYM